MRHAKSAMRAGRSSNGRPFAHKEHELASLTVKDVMSSQPVCVDAGFTVEAARVLMLERGVSALPIVDRQGRPLGIVSKTDLLREIPEYEYRELRPEKLSRPPDPLSVEPDDGDDEESDGFFVVKVPYRSVSEVMTPFVFVLDEATPLPEAARLMARERVHRLPIVDGEGTVIGIISTLDIVRLIAGWTENGSAPRSGARQRRK